MKNFIVFDTNDQKIVASFPAVDDIQAALFVQELIIEKIISADHSYNVTEAYMVGDFSQSYRAENACLRMVRAGKIHEGKYNLVRYGGTYYAEVA